MRHRGRFRIFQAAVSLLVLALPTVRATSADAAGACLSAHPNYFDGWGYYSRQPTSWQETPVGVSAFVRARPGVLCNGTTPSSAWFTTAWVMLFDNDSDGGLAQAGFIRAKPSGSGAECNYHFSEWHRDNVNPWGTGQGSRQTRYDLGCVSDGTDTAYRVTRVVQGVPTGNSGAVQMTLGLSPNVTLLDTTPFDIAVWSAWTLAYSGEAIDQFSDVPGSAAAPTRMFAMGIQSRSDGVFRSTPCYLGNITNNSRYAQAAASCTDVTLWTK